MDEFREIPGRPGYRVNRAGTRFQGCKRTKRVPGTPRRVAVIFTDVWHDLKLHEGRDGYYYVSCVTFGGISRPVRLHFLVLEAFVGPRPEGMEGRHKDGNPKNNTAGNLAWATHAENMADIKIHGTTARGESHGRVKLRASDVVAIRDMRARGETLASLGKQYGVTFQTISDIANRKSWTHI